MTIRWLPVLFVLGVLTGCGSNGSTGDRPALENTRWALIRVADSPVGGGSVQRDPHLILRRQDHRVSGFTGCNQMTGAYTLDGPTLAFGQMISTRMACLEAGGMETEAAFTAALQQVRGWSITGERLTLSDAAGRPVIELESRGPAPNTL